MLFAVDANGQMLWEQTEPSIHTMYSSVEQQPDGGFLILASRYNGQVFDIILIKTDSEGNYDH
jgi:hypothetical protein